MNSINTNNVQLLSNEEIKRYSRQLIIPEFGIDNQTILKYKSALIIGCGGLGCPAALYLCTSGIGRLGLVDNDSVEISNIHRQIAHDIDSVGKSKAHNLAHKCKALNDLVTYDVHECLLEKANAISIISKYDVVLDCTDNVITRYLINDVCALQRKPLVSGGALRFEGQLTVYNYLNGPCYRCLYPKAPPPETVSNCSDAGIMGPIVGTIGSLQALEAIKVLTKVGSTLNGRMLIFDGLDFQTRIIKLRPRQTETCVICKVELDISEQRSSLILDKFDYCQFCGVTNYNDTTLDLNILDEATQRVSCNQFKLISDQQKHNLLLIDVRPECQFKICSLPNSLNIPYDELVYNKESALNQIKNELDKINSERKSIYVLCRRGNDSQLAVKILSQHFLDFNFEALKDIIGGLQSWANTVDKEFPKY